MSSRLPRADTAVTFIASASVNRQVSSPALLHPDETLRIAPQTACLMCVTAV